MITVEPTLYRGDVDQISPSELWIDVGWTAR